MKHKHHIIPRHSGGTDEKSNLIELTIEEHAEAHRLLYEQYNKEEDRIAWLGLSGQVSMNEASKMAMAIGASKGGQIAVNTGQILSAQQKAVETLRKTGFAHFKKLGHYQGKINAENGHLQRICNNEIRSRGGKNSAKRLNRKVISSNDGHVTTFASRRFHEKKTGYTHIWENYEETI